jgi:hypothetical protein
MQEDCGGEEFEAAALMSLDGSGVVPYAEEVGVIVGAVRGLGEVGNDGGDEGFVRTEKDPVHGL